MKNLKTVAKELGFYPLSELKHCTNYTNLKGVETKLPFEELEGFEIGVFHNTHKEDGKTYAEEPTILVKHKYSDLCFRPFKKSWNTETYGLVLPYEYQKYYKNLGQWDKKTIREQFNAPNYVGKFTEKKLKAWVTYRTEEHNAYKALFDKQLNDYKANTKKALQLAKELGAEKSSRQGINETHIQTDLFYLKVHHSFGSTYRVETIFEGNVEDVREIHKLMGKN